MIGIYDTAVEFSAALPYISTQEVSMSKAGTRILKSVRQARAMVQRAYAIPDSVDVKAIRESQGLSQVDFANRYGFSAAAVRDWEQHRRQPEATARVLLLVIKHNPLAVQDAIIAECIRETEE